MKTVNSLIYLAAIAILGITLSCGGGSAAMGEEGNVNISPAQGVRTSSDMNISPANMEAQDPEFRRANDSVAKAIDSVPTPKQ